MTDFPNSQQILSFQQAYQRIKTLMDEEKLADAHRACLELLRFDPENIQVIRLKNKIEHLVKNYNRKVIEQELKALKPLWKEKKYEELLSNLKKYVFYIDDYPPLKKIILKAEKAYNLQLLEEHKKFYKLEFEHITSLMREKKFPEALRTAEKLRLLNLHDDDIKNLIDRLRATWIQNEIDENRLLLQGENFEAILLFYQKLKRIDPDSTHLENLINSTKKKYHEYKIDQKKEFIYQGLEKIRTLYQLKKYEKALLAVQEILDLDPDNKSAQQLLKKAKKKMNVQMENELIVQMLGAQKFLQREYQVNPAEVKKI